MLWLRLLPWVVSAAVAASPARLREGDEAFSERRRPESARKALEIYGELHRAAPDDVAIAWRFAMASQMVGHRLTAVEEEKARLFEAGRDAALKAVKQDPDCGPCHFWAGINMAQYAETVGPLKMLFSLKAVQKHLKEAAAKDPGYAFAGPYRVLGLIEWRLPGILGGSDDRAREYLEKAIEASPKSPLNYFFLSRLLEEEFDDKAGALALARRGLSQSPPDPREIESHEARRELQALENRLAKSPPVLDESHLP